MVEHAHMVTDGEGFFLVMGDQNGAGAAGLEDIANLMAEAAAQLAIQVGEGLIEQQQLRLRSQSPGQGHALLLAAGQFMRVALAQVAELDQLQQLLGDAFAVSLLADTEADVLRHAQVGEQGVILKYHANPAFLRGQGKAGLGDDLIGQLDLTFQYRLETGDGAQGGGLAAARGAKQAANIAGIEVQIEVLHHAMVIEAATEVAQVQQQGLAHAWWYAGSTRNSSRAFCACRRFSA